MYIPHATKHTPLSVNFWRCNLTKQIRIGYWRKNGVFETVKTVKVKGDEYTGYEANAAYRIVELAAAKARAKVQA